MTRREAGVWPFPCHRSCLPWVPVLRCCLRAGIVWLRFGCGRAEADVGVFEALAALGPGLAGVRAPVPGSQGDVAGARGEPRSPPVPGGFEVCPNESGDAFPPLHQVAIPHMGLFIGEMRDFEELAAGCADDGRCEFFVAAAPVPFTGAVGGPMRFECWGGGSEEAMALGWPALRELRSGAGDPA